MTGTAAPIEVFISYAEEDNALREDLEKHLAALVREGVIAPWSSHELRPGDDWREAVGEHLGRAGVILLLLSADFLAAEERFDVEVERALTRARSGEARVIAVRVRPYDWGSVRFDRVPVLPSNGDPVTTWSNRDEAWADVVRGLRMMLAGSAAAPTRAPQDLPPRRLFVGRGQDLLRVGEALRGDGRAPGFCASLWGLGGVGKTALALEHAYRALDEGSYPCGVFWLSAEGQALDAMVRLAGILRRHGLVDVPMPAPAVDLASAARRALSALPAPSLLVLDDVSEIGFGAHLPGGQARVLITTRDRRLALGKLVDLDVLAGDDARRLAIDLVGGPPEGEEEAAALGRVVEARLGGLAVAIEVAACAVRDWAHDWVAYERHLAGQPEQALEEPARGDHPLGVFAALDLSIDRCGAEAQRLLEGAAAFARGAAVPLAWAHAVAEVPAESIPAQKALGQIEGLSLARIDRRAGTMSLHQLVHARVASRAQRIPGAQGAAARAMQQVLRWIQRAAGPTREQMEEVDARRAHVDAVMAAAERAGDAPAWSSMADHLANHLRHRALHAEARDLLARVLTIEESIHGPEHPRVSSALSNLAMEIKELGEPAAAAPLLQRALLIDQRTLSPDDPRLATHLSNLALVLRDLGAPAAALPLLTRAVAIDGGTLSPENQDAIKRLSNLGLLLCTLGDAPAARPHLERALALLEKAHGPEHPSVAVVLTNLATAHRGSGDPAAARPLLERCLSIDEHTFGPEHPSVARDLSNLALVLSDLGEPSAAYPLLERAVGIADKALGPAHPSAKLMRANLSSVGKKLGKT